MAVSPTRCHYFPPEKHNQSELLNLGYLELFLSYLILTTWIVVPGNRVQSCAKNRECTSGSCNDGAIPPQQAGHQGNHSSGHRRLVQAIAHPNPTTCGDMKLILCFKRKHFQVLTSFVAQPRRLYNDEVQLGFQRLVQLSLESFVGIGAVVDLADDMESGHLTRAAQLEQQYTNQSWLS